MPCVIHVSPAFHAPRPVAETGTRHLLSLLDPGRDPIIVPGFPEERRLTLWFDDVEKPDVPGAPTADHVRTIVEFGRSWSGDGPLVVHCMAGIARSPAAALILLCAVGNLEPEEAAARLAVAAPHVWPNRLMLRLADGVLGLGGRLAAVGEAWAPRVVADAPVRVTIQE